MVRSALSYGLPSALSAGFAVIVGGQIAAVTALLSRRTPSPPSGMSWPLLAGLVAGGACLAAPTAAIPLGVLAHGAVYTALLHRFGGSLRRGREPIATRLARRIGPALSARRLAYTRAVTWLWTMFFAAAFASALAQLMLLPFRALPWWLAGADLPLVALLFAGELSVRAVWFRGEPHGSARDMLRAFRAARGGEPTRGRA
jgi:hypothetical protein